MTKRILVVDDEKDIVEIYRKALSAAGYEVICAYNGEEGLNVLRANPRMDLLVLDLKMPKMSGDELLKILRRDAILKDTKVLVMSSVLFHYKEIPRYDPRDGRYSRTEIIKKGLSKIAQAADKTTGPQEDKLEMEEKAKASLEWSYLFGYAPEKEADFERRAADDLLKRVKGIFGEPYEDAPHKPEGSGLASDKPEGDGAASDSRSHSQSHKHREATAIEEKTKDIIAKMLKIDKEKRIYSNMSFAKDLGTAFIDATALRRRLEKEFKIKLGWENQEEIETVGDLIYSIERLKMLDRTEKERTRESNRKFWELLKPVIIVNIVVISAGLAFFIWQALIKPHLIRNFP